MSLAGTKQTPALATAQVKSRATEKVLGGEERVRRPRLILEAGLVMLEQNLARSR